MEPLRCNRPSIVRRAAIARGHDPISLENRRQIAREQLEASQIQPQPVRDFAQQVALATNGPCLRYSQRLHLLDLARTGGINRFDANLIIAAIEHHANRKAPRPRETSSPAVQPISDRALLLSAALAVQLGIVLTAWVAFLR